MPRQTTPYGLSVTVRADYADVVERTRTALATEGFGVLAEMDIADTLKKKLNVDFRPYVILGACNPPLAYQALNAERDIGLLLPCNVIVYAGDESGTTVISAMDPVAALQLTGNPAIEGIAREVRDRLARVLDAVERAVSA